ncbi:glycosyl hydrolase family 18 protein [Microscilla marina]|uniref:Glycosyl hydrolase, family 18 n=1 Tax=Microscilla marina ATCC 23134 TaxID=313606 RepID=A1ZX26_MICM2|nr:glycosyl hydrolase family 18 protein [Microscilla marina]EAY25106.1 glycosyl hydrolase, family 18 [Microscilla marina ATCC 23134]
MALKKLLTIIFISFACHNFVVAQIVDKINETVDQKNKAAKQAKADSIKKAQEALQKAKADAEKANEKKTTQTGTFYDKKQTFVPGGVGETGTTQKPTPVFDPSHFIEMEKLSDDGKPKEKKDTIRSIDTTNFASRYLSVKQEVLNFLYQESNKDKSFQAGLQRKLKFGKSKHPLYQYKKHKLKDKLKTFGWHPHWMKDAYKNYNFSLLSAVAFFSYQLDPGSGTYTNPAAIKEWKSTKMITEAKKYNTKILMSVYLGGAESNKAFLTNQAAQTNFIRIILALLKEREAHGVHLDFEGLGSDQKQAFTEFVLDLSSQLRKAVKNSWLTISLPPINFDDAYDVRALDKYVNLFVLSGNEFYGEKTQDISGPLSIIKSGGKWWDYDMNRAVDEYLASGVTAEKLLLTVNYYGGEWITDKLGSASASEFVKYRTYFDIQKFLGNAEGYEEPESMSMYYPFKIDGKYHQIWYEDSLSLAKKYDWIISKKIGGVGIWALGFDNGSVKLWEALASKIAKPLPKLDAKKKGSNIKARGFFSRIRSSIMRLIRNPAKALQNPSYFASMLVLLLGPAFAGFYVIYRHGCRLKRSLNLILKGGIILFLIMAFALVTLVLTKFKHTTPIILVMAGFVVGAIVFLLLTRRSLSERELP